MCLVFMQELPAEDVREDLVETGQVVEILQKQCPAEYNKLKEEEVTAYCFRNATCSSSYCC